ncbi:MAG: hypothetical protein Q9164_005282 [Protoblastenia rupestris]
MDDGTDGQDVANVGKEVQKTTGAAHKGSSSPKKNTQPTHQRLVFTDPAAFRYLEEDPSTTVLERRRRLTGYELYIVEQWACSRKHPTFVITTYTGLEQHSVVVGVLGVSTDENAWSPRLRVYLKAISRYHARKKETPVGTLMVTNLSGFPSALTVTAVPNGDLRSHREAFIVNENLKRMGCSGRAGLNLSPPIGATQAKFRELYHTSDQVPIVGAVVELVKLCQAALMLYGKLAPEYADGLLCDVTEQAISDWWADLGSDYFNIEPNDGILGPTTVGAILGILMGARKRLSIYGSPVAKDVFDILSTKRAVSHFQRSQKMERTRRLDRPTLDRLHKVTAKAANSEGWAMPRAVKSTVAELSGKGGEMVNGREKAGIAEVETLDINTFIQLGSGDRFKWLWYGKPRKTSDTNGLSSLDDGLIFNDDDHGNQGWTGRKRESVDDELSLRHTLSDRMYQASHPSQASVDHFGSDQGLRRAALKNVSGKVTDARSGLGRIRDAVARRGHHHKYSKEENAMTDDENVRGNTPRESLEQRPDRVSDASFIEQSPNRPVKQSTTGSKDSSRRGSNVLDDDRSKGIDNKSFDGDGSNDLKGQSNSSLDAPSGGEDTTARSDYMNLINDASGISSRNRGGQAALERDWKDVSLTENDYQAIDKMEHFDWASSKLPPLRATRSLSALRRDYNRGYCGWRWPRRMSFSDVVDVISIGVSHSEANNKTPENGQNPDLATANEKILAIEAQNMESSLQCLKMLETSWVESKVAQIEAFDQQCGNTQSKMDEIYHQKLNDNHDRQDFLEALLAEKKSSLIEAMKEAETLDAKLEYELQALQSKVEEVESGLVEFERQIRLLEARAVGLDENSEAKGSWLRRWLGIGIF